MKIAKFLLLIAPLFSFAQEARVEVGTRPMSEEAKAQAQAQANGEERQTSGFIFDRYPPIYFSNAHHNLVAVTFLDSDKYSLELEDGSVWKIHTYDGSKALNWRANDPLLITQNNRWFSNFAYRIINKTNGTSVEANLFLGPLEHGLYTRYIIGIDSTRRELILSDSTHWEISYLDISFFKDWALNDAIILGTNSGWDSSCEALLINVNMNNAARAKQY